MSHRRHHMRVEHREHWLAFPDHHLLVKHHLVHLWVTKAYLLLRKVLDKLICHLWILAKLDSIVFILWITLALLRTHLHFWLWRALFQILNVVNLPDENEIKNLQLFLVVWAQLVLSNLLAVGLLLFEMRLGDVALPNNFLQDFCAHLGVLFPLIPIKILAEQFGIRESIALWPRELAQQIRCVKWLEAEEGWWLSDCAKVHKRIWSWEACKHTWYQLMGRVWRLNQLTAFLFPLFFITIKFLL